LSDALVWHLERLANRSSLPRCLNYSYLATACCGSFLYMFLPIMNHKNKYMKKIHLMLMHHHKKHSFNVHGSLRPILQSSQPLNFSKGWKYRPSFNLCFNPLKSTWASFFYSLSIKGMPKKYLQGGHQITHT
jgi:hypothetical protein